MTPAVPEFMSRLSTFAQKWIVEKRSARMMARSTTPYEEIKLFYDEVFPHFPDMIAFLDEFEPGSASAGGQTGTVAVFIRCRMCALCGVVAGERYQTPSIQPGFKTYYE